MVGFIDFFVDDPSSWTILLPSLNSNGNPFVDSNLLGGTCSFVGLKFSIASCVTTLFICSSVGYKLSCVCYYRCCKCYGLVVVSIQSSYTFASKCKCFSPSRNLVSYSLLTSWLYSLSYLSYGDVIYTFAPLIVSYGIVICGISIVCLATYTTVGTALTTISITDGPTLPLIIFCAFKSMIFDSLFIPKPKAPPSSTLLFLSRTLLGEFAIAFFLFFSVVYISSLVILTLVGGFYGFSF
jgi:hypothetical protein